MNAAKETFSYDNGFLGVNLRLDPALLAAGVMASAENMRFRDGTAAPRKGVAKLGWLNQVAAAPFTVQPFGQLFGAGTFQDPNSREWVVVAADGGAYLCREHNAAEPLAMPTGTTFGGRVVFRQAFGELFAIRGRYLAPLVCRDLADGFEDLVPRYTPGTVHAITDNVAYGPFQPAAISRVGLVVTVVTVSEHGYVTGADVEIAGATAPEFNGRWNITVLDDFTFTYVCPGVSVIYTGTITVTNNQEYWGFLSPVGATLTRAGTTVTGTTAAPHGYSPGDVVSITGAAVTDFDGRWTLATAAGTSFTYVSAGTAGAAGGTPISQKWVRDYGVMPNAEEALFINNRLLVVTAWTPGEDYTTTQGYTKADFIVAMDVQDTVHFDLKNFWRINQGAEDELLGLEKFGGDNVVCLKGRSWGVLSGVSGDLANIALDMREKEYGLTCNGASVGTGADVLFLSERRGVMSLRQTEQGQVQGVNLPFSDEIQPLIDRINWSYVRKARIASWENKHYVAVPLDDAMQWRPNLVPLGAQYVNGLYVLHGLEPGVTYAFAPGRNDGTLRTSITKGGVDTPLSSSDTFTARSKVAYLFAKADSTNAAVTAAVSLPALTGVNNAVLVYDTLTQKWNGMDTGSPMMVKEFFKARWNGVERLFFVAEDGFVNLVEESTDGDQTGSESWEPVIQKWTTRAYRLDNAQPGLALALAVTIATWAPGYSLTVLFDGVNEKQTMDVDGGTVFTRDRLKYHRPFDAPDWDPTNVNGDHGTPYREDYAVTVGTELNAQTGLDVEAMQDAVHNLAIAPRAGRWAQVRGENRAGRLALRGVMLAQERRRQRQGIKV